MKPFFPIVAILAGVIVMTPLHATQHLWRLTSPNHGQTYAYGSEQSHTWKMWPPDNHLALCATFDNNPFAEGSNQRFDNFLFHFPEVKLGSDGETFFYRPSKGLALPVAARRRGLLGITEIKLLPTAFLQVRKVHGYLTLTLIVGDRPLQTNPHTEIGLMH
jgi:hypothetical protein